MITIASITEEKWDEFMDTVNKLIMYMQTVAPTFKALADVGKERDRQNDLWGDQSNLPDGTGPGALWYGSRYYDELGDTRALCTAMVARDICEMGIQDGTVRWLDILIEEVSEALAEEDPEKLRAELVQVAAVAVQWIEAIDTRNNQ